MARATTAMHANARTYPAAPSRVRWSACRSTAQPSSVAKRRGPAVQVQRCAPGEAGRRVKRRTRGRTGRRGRGAGRRAGGRCCPSRCPVGGHQWTPMTRVARANGTGRPRWSVPIRLVGVPRPGLCPVAASGLVDDRMVVLAVGDVRGGVGCPVLWPVAKAFGPVNWPMLTCLHGVCIGVSNLDSFIKIATMACL